MLLYDDYFRSLELVGGTEGHVLQGLRLAKENSTKKDDNKPSTSDLSDFDIDI